MILFDDKTMERFENQITLETLDHLIIKAKKRQDKSFIFECLNKTLETQNCGAFHDLVPYVQFKKREKHP